MNKPTNCFCFYNEQVVGTDLKRKFSITTAALNVSKAKVNKSIKTEIYSCNNLPSTSLFVSKAMNAE